MLASRPVLLCSFSWLFLTTGAAAFAQSQEPPAVAVSKARALYYTPVDAGLKSFHCQVSFDWKEFIQKATNQPIADDDARLKYLKTIQLSVDDDLRGKGELHWTAPAMAPDASADSVAKIRDGMQQMWSGFFQSWNGFYTGDLLSLDSKSTVEKMADGYQVAVRTGASLAEETYNSKLLLKSVHVSTPSLDSTILPTFQQTAHGLMVSEFASSYKQPPSAPATEVNMSISYAPVGTYQLPSELTVAVGPAKFDFHLQECAANAQPTQP